MATRLKRLKIVQFRDVQPGTELHFHPGWNVILGRNGTGKTTLLHLLSMVLRDDFREISQEPFCLEYTLALPDGEYSAQVTNEALPPEVGNWRRYFATAQYTLSIDGMEPQHGTRRDDDVLQLKMGDQTVLLPRGFGLAALREVPTVFPEPPELRMDRWKHLNTRTRVSYRIDEAVALFDTIVASSFTTRVSIPDTCRISLFWQKSQNVWQTTSAELFDSGLIPPSVAVSVASAFTSDRSVVEVDLTGAPLLERLVALLGFQRVALVAKRGQTDATNEATLGEFTLYGYRAVGPPLHHSRWSFGQQRLFAIFWSLACNPDVLVADELTNGLHWEWIQACVAAIADRQVFVAVQNPLLLEHVGFESPEDVARAFVLCSLGADAEGAAQTRWSQPEAAQAQRFYQAWQRGIQPVHEVLMSEGLW